MKKIKDFLPEVCVEELVYDLCEYPDKYANPLCTMTSSEAVRVVKDWLKRETAEELEGVEPCREFVSDYEHYFSCGICVNSVEDEWLFCPHCGTKIDWRNEDGTS